LFEEVIVEVVLAEIIGCEVVLVYQALFDFAEVLSKVSEIIGLEVIGLKVYSLVVCSCWRLSAVVGERVKDFFRFV
jgi:hypothetical protein